MRNELRAIEQARKRARKTYIESHQYGGAAQENLIGEKNGSRKGGQFYAEVPSQRANP
jgi:hypothetical protein